MLCATDTWWLKFLGHFVVLRHSFGAHWRSLFTVEMVFIHVCLLYSLNCLPFLKYDSYRVHCTAVHYFQETPCLCMHIRPLGRFEYPMSPIGPVQFACLLPLNPQCTFFLGGGCLFKALHCILHVFWALLNLSYVRNLFCNFSILNVFSLFL